MNMAGLEYISYTCLWNGS
jgi:small subunit ribosomal protein S14e